ncbi:efflux RND transporter permease subunit [Methylobacterium radiotolerans]|uniref:efflux RND transporter permease subunit n=1 Tax=Methylobacterium radiotolerans TaxID=31998 RepID=UPI001F26AB73|nr:multidrug efflux RND transporter permease subunit [Methylobacterium radiotolerans]UIY41469.1 multidrug efflux RND transporter permease subunit [Methylobacterium radiotolerans]
MISRFFIERPVLANVLALVMVLIGAVSLLNLPVSQYPNVVPPTVQVTTRYPGASARTVVDTVALPIEQQVNGVEGMLYMQSTSASDGTYTLTVTFAIGTDGDQAQVLVQNRVAIAMSSLPQAVQVQGVTTQKKSTAVLQFVTLSASDGKFDSLFLSNYGVINVQNELARLPGVGNVTVFGAGQYAMRIWLDPDLVQARGLTPDAIINIVQQQSQEVTAGAVGMPPVPAGQDFQYTLNVNGRLNNAPDFENIVIKADAQDGGRITRLRDVGRVELGAQTYSQSFTLNGQPAAGIGIYQLPEANALTVANAVRARMAELAKTFPSGLVYAIPFDTTEFVQASIHEVYRTLFEAAVLVLIVILVFVQDWRAMLVPATTVPVTIIGAFAAMAAMGFSVNLSTLFAIVLAIGIVVDDAIVIVEGVSHHIDAGLSPRAAAEQAMEELFGPIIGITLVLMSVFVPAAFLPGLTGQLYKQFALVIAATALISAINAATLKPTQCALWLRKPVPPEERNVFYRGFNRVYGVLENGYARLIASMVRRSGLMVAAALLLIGLAGWGLTRLPTAFLPTEDQGYVLIGAQLPDGASKERTDAVMQRISARAKATPGVDNVLSISGISVLDSNATLPNAGVAYVVLKNWDARAGEKGQDLRSLYERFNTMLAGVEDADTFVLIPPPIQGIGNASGFTMQIELRNGDFDYPLLESLARTIVADGNAQSGLRKLNTSFRAGVPQIAIAVDRVKAEALGVTVGQVFSTLSSYVGSSYVTQFNKFGRTFQVYVQAAPDYRLRPEDVENLKVRAGNGVMVPLGTVVEIRTVQGPSLISLYNLYPTATIVGGAAPGFSSGQALDLMQQIAAKVLPPGTGYDWTAMSYQEKAVGAQIYLVFGLAILLVYLVLAGQYESWILPLAVLLGVPLALLGTVGALLLLGVANNLYTQIGLILLIALASKNAILIVEVAREKRQSGLDIAAAAVEAARLRFRPILMTSFAFILGVLPLVTASGAGAAARKSIGITVFSGMLASTCLAVLFVPSFYVILQRLEERRARGRQPGPVAAPPAAGPAPETGPA